MRFLVDENLLAGVAGVLRDAGHEATHVADHDLGGHPDADVMGLARREGSVVVTYDADFAAMAVLGGDALPSIVLFRDQQRTPAELAQVLLDNLDAIEQPLIEGAVVVFDPARVRVRSLPLDAE